MMLQRKLYDRLLEWKRESRGRTALLIEGARRVGKSTIAQAFGEREYRSHLVIDFARLAPEVRDLFVYQREDLDTFFAYLSAYYGVTFYERETLIVFDEIQRFPQARELLKYLVADGRYDYLETGSLISIKANVEGIVIPSEERKVPLEPLDFEEFLWATGDRALAELIRAARTDLKPLPDALHRKAERLFREYLLVGGMPQAVVQYLDQKDFGKVDEVKRDILELYRDDISKYAGHQAARVRRLVDAIPGQLSKHEKKFTLAAADRNARAGTYEEAFCWLDEARMVNICRNSTDPSVALLLHEDEGSFKCYQADTGLLVTQAFATRAATSDETYRAVLFDKLSINEGMLVENAVAQQLRANGDKLLFFSRYDRNDAAGNMEIDFLVVREFEDAGMKPRVSPVEVKSTKRYGTKSLDKFRARFGSRVGTEYVLRPRQLQVEGHRVSLPLYMAHVL